jgi:hypothetical protein
LTKMASNLRLSNLHQLVFPDWFENDCSFLKIRLHSKPKVKCLMLFMAEVTLCWVSALLFQDRVDSPQIILWPNDQRETNAVWSHSILDTKRGKLTLPSF